MFLPLHNLLNPAKNIIILLAHKWLPEASESFTLLRPRKAARWVPTNTLHPHSQPHTLMHSAWLVSAQQYFKATF